MRVFFPPPAVLQASLGTFPDVREWRSLLLGRSDENVGLSARKGTQELREFLKQP